MKNRRWILTIGLLCCAYGQLPGNATDKDHAQKTTQKHKESVEQQTPTAQEEKVDKKENVTLLSSMLYSEALMLVPYLSWLFVHFDLDDLKKNLVRNLFNHILFITFGALSGALTKFSFFNKRWIRNLFLVTFYLAFGSLFVLAERVSTSEKFYETKKNTDGFISMPFGDRKKVSYDTFKEIIHLQISFVIMRLIILPLVMFLLLEASRMLILHKEEELTKRPLLDRFTYGFMVVGSEFTALFFLLLYQKNMCIGCMVDKCKRARLDFSFLKNYWMLLCVAITLVFLLPYATDLLRSKLPQKWKPYSGQLLFLLSYECFRMIIFLMFAPPLGLYFFSLGVRSMYLSIIVGARLFSKMREELLTKKKKMKKVQPRAMCTSEK